MLTQGPRRSREPRPARILRIGLFAAVCASAVGRHALAQDAVTATSGSADAIARIRAGVAAIEREAPAYRRTTHDLQGFSLEGGELAGLYRGSELRKLAARNFGETWRGTEAFYFSGGRVIFIHVVHERYDRPMSGHVVSTAEDRLYFDGGRMIRRVRTQRPAAGDQGQLDQTPAELLRTAQLFAACARATGPEPAACAAPEP